MRTEDKAGGRGTTAGLSLPSSALRAPSPSGVLEESNQPLGKKRAVLHPTATTGKQQDEALGQNSLSEKLSRRYLPAGRERR